MNKKLSGVFTVILMINVLTSNIYAMEHLIDRNDREYSEILSLNDEILDSLNHGLVHSETGKDISEDELKMEQAFKDAADAVEVMITEGADAAMNRFNGHK